MDVGVPPPARLLHTGVRAEGAGARQPRRKGCASVLADVRVSSPADVPLQLQFEEVQSWLISSSVN